MRARVIWAVISLSLQEAAIVAVGLLGLPMLGIHLPLPFIIFIMVAWGIYYIVSFRLIYRIMRKKPERLLDLTGSKGKVVRPLSPEGMVMIQGELWQARSAGSSIASGEEIVVVRQEGMKLIVAEVDQSNIKSN